MNRRVHAFGDDALGHDDAVGLSTRLAAGEVTAAALVEAAIARIERVDPNLGAMAYRSYDEARRQAAQVGLEPVADGREPVVGGLLRGIPALVKDNVEFAGMPAQHGTDAYVAAPARADGDLARMWRATGLIALGKTRLSEYGFSASCEHARLGPVRNPWDPRFTAGASSSGSSALVAAGAVPLAHGNDGGGSIRIPAAVNGLVGLKPTRGRTAQDALFRQLPVRIISDGVLTRSVRDTAAFFAAAERVWRNPDLPPIGWVRRPSGPGFRVGLVTSSVTRRPSGEVVDAVERCGALLESLGHLVVPIDPPAPASFVDDFVNYWSQLALATVRTGRLHHGSSWQPARL
ncbi:MAG: amidase, partial [Nocardioides sp.]